MIFKVTYQASHFDVPTRETTQSLYVEADTEVAARKIIENKTPYNIEFIQPIDGKHLEYEKQNPDFQITEFNE